MSRWTIRQAISYPLAASLLILAASTSNATVMYTSTGGISDANIGFVIGMEFTPSVDIRVIDLGVFDGGSDGAGLQGDTQVGLWTNSGTLLASTTVLTTDVLDTGFRFSSITPIVLDALDTFVVGALYGNGAGDKLFGSAPTAASQISLGTGTRFISSNSLAFPSFTSAFNFRTTANLRFEQTQIPVPPSILLIGLGLAVLGYQRSRVTKAV